MCYWHPWRETLEPINLFTGIIYVHSTFSPVPTNCFMGRVVHWNKFSLFWYKKKFCAIRGHLWSLDHCWNYRILSPVVNSQMHRTIKFSNTLSHPHIPSIKDLSSCFAEFVMRGWIPYLLMNTFCFGLLTR